MSIFDTWPPVAGAHQRLCVHGALVRLRPVLHAGTDPGGYLRAYWDQLDAVPEARDVAGWRAGLARFEARADGTPLPLAALRALPAVGDEGLDVVCVAALPEEDPRFGDLIAGLQEDPARRRPTVGLLAAMTGLPDGARVVRRLVGAGVLEVEDPSVPDPDRTVRPTPGLWALARGEDPGLSWWRLRRPVDPAALVAPAGLRARLARLPAALQAGPTDTVIVRGPATTGRRTLLDVLAHDLGLRGVDLDPAALADGRRRAIPALAAATAALPIVALDPAPGETVTLPALGAGNHTLGVVLPEHGGVDGPRARHAVTLHTLLPDRDQRAGHWRAAGLAAQADALADRLRMTGGHIRRTAELARAQATLVAHPEPTGEDVRTAARGLHAALFDTLCDPVAPARGLDAVTCEPTCRRELELLVVRCRHRDELAERATAPTPGATGVRALFCGPSGTGKTLAARAVAGELGTDLYRVDLSRVVDKYIGETEKNLARVFDRAEQADVVLLLDEGDALLTQRTAVATSTDRYANLETNYLLARLEVFRGVLIVTTNAADRIDDAFRRRMDLVVDFPPPTAAERLEIWRAHLPDGHAITDDALEQVAAVCALHGGQIRTAAEHALLLSVSAGRAVGDVQLTEGVRREYRKVGEVCPLAEESKALV